MMSTRVDAERGARRRWVLLAAMSAVLVAGFGAPTIAQGALTAPSYVVVSSGLTTEEGNGAVPIEMLSTPMLRRL